MEFAVKTFGMLGNKVSSKKGGNEWGYFGNVNEEERGSYIAGIRYLSSSQFT